MTKKEITNFLDLHPFKEFSVARLEYSLYLTPEVESFVNKYTDEYMPTSEEERQERNIVEETDAPDDLIRLMRKSLHNRNCSILRQKLLQHEEEIMPLIQKKALTNRQDNFIENALHFFLHSEKNCCDWIIENYNSMKSEYMKSLLCLVLGFRGDVSLIPMLMRETERFEMDYPYEDYEQAPFLAVYELAVRFMNYK